MQSCRKFWIWFLISVADCCRIIDRIRVENRTWTMITSKHRIERHMFEPVSVRKAVINMLVHNQYIYGHTLLLNFFLTDSNWHLMGIFQKDYLKIYSSKESADHATERQWGAFMMLTWSSSFDREWTESHNITIKAFLKSMKILSRYFSSLQCL